MIFSRRGRSRGGRRGRRTRAHTIPSPVVIVAMDAIVVCRGGSSCGGLLASNIFLLSNCRGCRCGGCGSISSIRYFHSYPVLLEYWLIPVHQYKFFYFIYSYVNYFRCRKSDLFIYNSLYVSHMNNSSISQKIQTDSTVLLGYYLERLCNFTWWDLFSWRDHSGGKSGNKKTWIFSKSMSIS